MIKPVLRRYGLLLAVLVAILAVVGVGLTLDPFDQSLRDSLRAPSLDHWFGTDQLGRDVLARVAHAFLLDIGLSLVIVAASLALGTAIGLVAGEFGGAVDAALGFTMDIIVALPSLIIALVIASHVGGGGGALVLSLTLSGWVKYARVVRAETSRLKQADFIVVARVIGASRPRVLIRHVVPNVLPMLGGLIALQVGHAILSIAALGFLGLGVQPPTPEWGAMIADARPYIARAPWLAIFPGLMLFLLTALMLTATRIGQSQRTPASGESLAIA